MNLDTGGFVRSGKYGSKTFFKGVLKEVLIILVHCQKRETAVFYSVSIHSMVARCPNSVQFQSSNIQQLMVCAERSS
jgi:hypothetical protein